MRLQAQEASYASASTATHPHAYASSSSSSSSSLPKYRGTFDALRSILRLEGWRGLYAGLVPAVTGSGVAWGLYFMAYNGFKEQFRGRSQENDGGGLVLTPLQNLFCAAEAGVAVTLLTNPIWVLKTRLQLQLGGGLDVNRMKGVEGLRTKSRGSLALQDRYTGMSSAIRSIWRKEGVAGFYRGIWPSLMLVTQGSMQLMAYEALTSVTQQQQHEKDGHAAGAAELSSLQVGAIGACSKLFAVFFTYPLQVARTRLQKRQTFGGEGAKHKTTTGTLSVFRNILYKEGFVGLYKGMIPNLMRTMPQSAITFAVYEKVKSYL